MIITQEIKETIPLFELCKVEEEIELSERCIDAINKPRPDDFDKLMQYIIDRSYLGFDDYEDTTLLMWIGSTDPMGLFTPDLQIRTDLHGVIRESLKRQNYESYISRMGPWRCQDAALIGNFHLL